MFVVGWGAHVRILTPINDCRSNAKFAWTLMMFILVKMKMLFDVHVYTTFVLTLSVLLNFWTLYGIVRILCIYVVRAITELWDSLHTPNARWLAFWNLHVFDMRIFGVVQVLSCSHLVDHISIQLIFKVNLINQRSFFGRLKMTFSCASLPTIVVLKKIQRVVHAQYVSSE